MPDEGVYVDTSVLGAYYCPEPLSAAADDALRKIRIPVISLLGEVEFHSLIAKKRRIKDLNERQAKSVLELFGNHVAEGHFRRLPLTAEHFIKARELAGSMASSLRTLDALHLAAAMIDRLTLITADRTLAKAARRHKSKVIVIA